MGRACGSPEHGRQSAWFWWRWVRQPPCQSNQNDQDDQRPNRKVQTDQSNWLGISMYVRHQPSNGVLNDEQQDRYPVEELRRGTKARAIVGCIVIIQIKVHVGARGRRVRFILVS